MKIVIICLIIGVATVICLIFISVFVYILTNRETKELTPDVRRQLGGTYITLAKGVTHYELTGKIDGRMVVLIHGISIPLWTWDPHMDALKNAGLRVLRYDMYGRGYSDRPKVCYNRKLFIEQLRDLLDSLKIKEPVDLVGSSLGAAIAVSFNATYPERVGRLALISPLVNSGNLPNKIFRPLIIGEFLFRTIGMPFFTKRARKFYQNHPQADEYMQKYLEQISYKGVERSALSAVRNDLGGDYRPSYKKVGHQNRQTLLIWGSEDKEFTKEKIEEARTLLGNVNLQIINGVGHGVELHLKPEVNELLVDYLIQKKN